MRNSISALLLVGAGIALSAAIASRWQVGHPVTPRMESEAEAVAGRVTGSLLAEGSDGRTYRLGESSGGRPRVLVFIKGDCPCSEAADPCFARLYSGYRDRAEILGVIDGGLEEAKGWADRHGTPYPILADPDKKLIRALGAESSVYTALIDGQGTVEHLWPGYSSSMLQELGRRLAKLTDTAAAKLDFGDAPEELTTGCSF
ncbi:peroxiredoxin family protein [Singulisphaera sp. PoT]|uniref:peroxiredoxin family protein n=1 Tax=Singulisphaera sp. PoT TaxID=3411797 RepID=UPI003BF4B839